MKVEIGREVMTNGQKKQTNLIDVPDTAYDYSFYTCIPDGWRFGPNTNTRKFPYIVDSGTTLNYLPSSKFSHVFL